MRVLASPSLASGLSVARPSLFLFLFRPRSPANDRLRLLAEHSFVWYLATSAQIPRPAAGITAQPPLRRGTLIAPILPDIPFPYVRWRTNNVAHTARGSSRNRGANRHRAASVAAVAVRSQAYTSAQTGSLPNPRLRTLEPLQQALFPIHVSPAPACGRHRPAAPPHQESGTTKAATHGCDKGRR